MLPETIMLCLFAMLMAGFSAMIIVGVYILRNYPSRGKKGVEKPARTRPLSPRAVRRGRKPREKEAENEVIAPPPDAHPLGKSRAKTMRDRFAEDLENE